MRKKITLAALVTAAAIGTTACSVVNTQPDQQALRYSDPIMGAKEYKEHFGPSTHDMAGMMNTTYTYPAGQRVYAFLPEGGDTGMVSPTTKDAVTLQVAGSVRFALTSDTEELKQFHEKIGLRMKAYEDEGWREFLRVYLKAPVERALADATQEFTWKEIYTNTEAKAAWEKKVAELLPRYVEQAIGGDYIGEFQVTLQKPILPDSISQAVEQVEAEAQKAQVQEQTNERVRSELDSIRDLVDVLGVDGYIQREAVKDGRVQVLPIPAGTGVSIPTN